MKRFIVCFAVMFFLCIQTNLFPQDFVNALVIHADKGQDTISRHIYSHFSEHLGHCIYEGLWVGEKSDIPNIRGIRKDVTTALKEMGIPSLRWPGGCFADEYHWKNGIGPKETRPAMINSNWGAVTEDNSFGTHEFLDLCEQIKCEPIITGNLGSGSVEEMSQWVEYINSDNISPITDLRKKNRREKAWHVKFWGLGNESWGCGGNMNPDYYFNLANRYSTFCRDYGDNKLFRIASGASDVNFDWTETFMRMWAAKPEGTRNNVNGLSLHYYTVCHDWNQKGSATKFDKSEMALTLYKTLQMDDFINKHSAIMDKYDPQKKVALIVDEWGDWFDVEPGTNPGFLFQQNTLRDALVAGINLNIFNNHCDRVKMANIAQLANVLQSVILTRGKDLVLTPTYYIFKMYKAHQDALMLPYELSCADLKYDTLTMKALSVSASKDKSGKIHISLVNLDIEKKQVVECRMTGKIPVSVKGEIVTSKEMNAYNDFGKSPLIKAEKFEGAKLNNGKLNIEMPPLSVVVLEVD
jgi:alpha-L-arabinofuranosidase